MSRSHPPSLLRIAERALVDDALAPAGSRVVVACSGGPDSTALLHVLARLGSKFGFGVVAHGVDHGLRAAAADELALASSVAERLGVPFAVTRVNVASGANLQARARSARFKALVAAANEAGASAIATGHTADDRAETLLMRLLRGAGPRGLAVLPPSAPAPGAPAVALIRPIVRARRSCVLAHLKRHDLPFAIDPSNRDARFLRARVRAEVLPGLEAMAPRVVEHLSELADMLGELAPTDPALSALGRAQRQMVERARRLGRRSVRLRLQGGRDVEVSFSSEGAVLIQDV